MVEHAATRAIFALALWAMLASPVAATAAAGEPLRLAQSEAPADPPEQDEADEESHDDDSPGHAARDATAPDYVVPAVETDAAKLPFPVRRMRELLIEAARSGDIERLRPFVGSGDDMTLLTFGGISEDPITFLKSVSGDPDGHEILAILLEVLEAGYVHVEAGTENEMFIWPYFYALPLDRLTAPQRVELFTLLTYGDYEEMLSFGAYIFYRVGITPAGRWRFFVAGD
ncbi:MAG: hypothetical protein BroJett030_31050 [Alphaproteobacteria bacterium]|nr:MAG: hypothetical protein BroJett030_31050 [Alphaproteobacteria bacterium]